MKKSITVALAALAVVGVSMHATEARAHTEKEAGSLASTGVDADARGKVKLAVRNLTDGKLEIKGQKLDPNATFDVLVDGVLVGQFTTNNGGSGRIRFRSRPRSPHDELLGFDPRGALVVVRNAAGQDLLAVQLADSGSVGDGDVICCIPDNDGTECEDRTPEECAMQGGTVSTATSCLPDPCAGVAPPVEDVVCCIPDDNGPECEDRTADECAAQGGIVVEATSCDPNPCEPVTPPANQDIQCCLPDNGGSECEDRTPAECAVEGGVNAGVGTCSPDPCQAIPPPSGNATVKVRCELRSDRSKISVDGNNLATGTYLAMVTSGANTASAPGQQTIGDEVEFDFDSEPDDIAAGATAIAADFIQGTPPQVTGTILTLGGSVVVQATVDCAVN